MTASAAEELVEFLLARIADDETFAEMVAGVPKISAGESRRVQEGNATFIPLNLASSPSRVLAECEAKRRIVAGLTGVLGQSRQREQRQNAETTLRHLAAVYADHPDYRQEWRS
jgi:hypothetical protein